MGGERKFVTRILMVMAVVASGACSGQTPGQAPGVEAPAALIDGTGPEWRALGEADFVDVNGDDDTWSFDGEMIRTTGVPIGVNRTREPLTNFELVVEWRHLEPGGNSGMFLWVPPEALEGLQPDNLPDGGIEIQMLDHDYRRQYEERTGREGDWFTTNGDVFAVGRSELDPFEPISPDGSRSFPTEERSRGAGEWNHYYVRAINGEVRLWVNGREVSGGRNAVPATGYLSLEAEGAPVEFRGLRIRELP